MTTEEESRPWEHLDQGFIAKLEKADAIQKAMQVRINEQAEELAQLRALLAAVHKLSA